MKSEFDEQKNLARDERVKLMLDNGENFSNIREFIDSHLDYDPDWNFIIDGSISLLMGNHTIEFVENFPEAITPAEFFVKLRNNASERLTFWTEVADFAIHFGLSSRAGELYTEIFEWSLDKNFATNWDSLNNALKNLREAFPNEIIDDFIVELESGVVL